MAVIIGQYIVTGNNKQVADYAYGVKYPIAMTGQTFELAYDNITRLKANLKNLLSTQQGERLNQPLFGTTLHKLIFEQDSPELNEKIYEAIQTAVARYVPNVTVDEIEINDNGRTENGQMNVSVTFSTTNDRETFGVNFKVQA